MHALSHMNYLGILTLQELSAKRHEILFWNEIKLRIRGFFPKCVKSEQVYQTFICISSVSSNFFLMQNRKSFCPIFCLFWSLRCPTCEDVFYLNLVRINRLGVIIIGVRIFPKTSTLRILVHILP